MMTFTVGFHRHFHKNLAGLVGACRKKHKLTQEQSAAELEL